MTSDDHSNTGTVVMQYNTSNCLVHQSKITFCNTHDKEEYEAFVNRKL